MREHRPPLLICSRGGRARPHGQEVVDVGYTFGVGREAPAFAISAVDGNEINLRQYRGDWFPVLVFLPSQADAAGQALQRLGTAAGALWGLRGQLLAVCVAESRRRRRAGRPGPDLSPAPRRRQRGARLRRVARRRHGAAAGFHHRSRRQDRMERRGCGGARSGRPSGGLPPSRALRPFQSTLHGYNRMSSTLTRSDSQ